MDISLVTGAYASLKAAKDIGSALLEVRDFNQTAAKVAQLNDLLLKAQDSLFAHNAQLLELQGEHLETSQKLRKLEETLAERARYTLFEITTARSSTARTSSQRRAQPARQSARSPSTTSASPATTRESKACFRSTSSTRWSR